MTFGQMSLLFQQRMDVSGSPPFTPQEIDNLLNWAYNDWYKEFRPRFNKEQAITVRLTHLLKPLPALSNTSQITLAAPGTNIPDYRDLARMNGTWNKTDCYGSIIVVGGVNQTVTRNIVPVPLNVVDTNTQDPFNSPNDEYPMYKQSNNGTVRVINILSTTSPLNIVGEYFKLLQIIDSENNPDTPFEAQDYIAEEVIEIAKVLGKTDLDDFQNLQATEQEVAQGI